MRQSLPPRCTGLALSIHQGCGGLFGFTGVRPVDSSRKYRRDQHRCKPPPRSNPHVAINHRSVTRREVLKSGIHFLITHSILPSHPTKLQTRPPRTNTPKPRAKTSCNDELCPKAGARSGTDWSFKRVLSHGYAYSGVFYKWHTADWGTAYIYSFSVLTIPVVETGATKDSATFTAKQWSKAFNLGKSFAPPFAITCAACFGFLAFQSTYRVLPIA